MKIWEVHAMHTGGRVRTTADGHCEIDGLLLSERAYLLAVRDIRPAQLLRLVEENKNDLKAAASRLIARANENGGPDNITACLIRWVGPAN